MSGYLQNRHWTRLEVAIWLLALALMVTGGVLVLTQAGGYWVLAVGGVIVASLGLMRYRADAERRKRNADG
jgi:hypothetical protein